MNRAVTGPPFFLSLECLIKIVAQSPSPFGRQGEPVLCPGIWASGGVQLACWAVYLFFPYLYFFLNAVFHPAISFNFFVDSCLPRQIRFESHCD